MAKNIKRIQVPGVTEPYNVIDATAIHKTDVATSNSSGIVKIGSGITVAADGTISVNVTAPVTSVNGKTGDVVLNAADVGLGNVDNIKQYSESNPPPYPVTSVNGMTGNVTIKPKCVTVTLSSSGWDSTAKTQTAAVSGVLADETKQLITPTPAIASQTAYYNAGIRCTGQSANSLTFTAKTISTADLTVYVTIQEVGA